MSGTAGSHANNPITGSNESKGKLHQSLSISDLHHTNTHKTVPAKVQEKAPKGLEDELPNSVHNTGSDKGVSHATGESKVPKVLQEAVPKSVEEKLPESIHPTK